MTLTTLSRAFAAALSLFLLVSAGYGADGDLLDVRDSADQPVKLIFDTDIGGDIDDAFALAIIHVMADRGKCELLGVTTTNQNASTPGYVAAFNAWYGRPAIPVGAGKGRNTDRYLSAITSQRLADGTPEYPIPAGFEAGEAVRTLRGLLASAEDRSVVVVQVGWCSNLATLLDSPADDLSPMTGRELAERKVRLLSVMGGAFVVDETAANYSGHKEFNIVNNVPAAQKLAREWPTEMVFSGYELGDRLRMQPVSLKNDLTRRAKILHDSFGHWASQAAPKEGFDHRRPTWDLTSVLFVLRPEEGRDYFSLSEFGNVDFTDAGVTVFTPNPSGKSRCFLQTEAQRVRAGEAIVDLCSEP